MPGVLMVLTAEDLTGYGPLKCVVAMKNRDGSAYPYGYDSVERVRDRFGGNQLLAGYYGILDQHNVRRNVRVLERQYRRLDKAEHFVNVRTGDMRQRRSPSSPHPLTLPRFFPTMSRL